MKPNPQQVKVSDIIERRDNGLLRADPEYQRGVVWTPAQMAMLVDSVLRGYPLPLFYFRHVKTPVPGLQDEWSHRFDVIDGQQRISALCSFHRGFIIDDLEGDGQKKKFPPLLDPSAEKNQDLFPLFIQREPCPWTGMTYNNLPKDLKDKFLGTLLQVVNIECGQSEARDLFTRLQRGKPLTGQEKRDALHGDFATLVLKHGGGKSKYLGHDFFPQLMGMNPSRDRGDTRKLAAQILMMLLYRAEKGPDTFVDFKEGEIDKPYHRYVDLPHDSPAVTRFEAILDGLVRLLGDGTRPNLKKHSAIHLSLFMDSIMNGNYTSKWEGYLAEAFDAFTAGIAGAPQAMDLRGGEDEITRDFANYSWMTSNQANKAATIRKRHDIFVRQMSRLMSKHDALVSKDDERGPHRLLKEYLYFQQEKKCQECGRIVRWGEAEFHHVLPHRKGGKTEQGNLALVHEMCHPKGEKNELSFEEKWKLTNAAASGDLGNQ